MRAYPHIVNIACAPNSPIRAVAYISSSTSIACPSFCRTVLHLDKVEAIHDLHHGLFDGGQAFHVQIPPHHRQILELSDEL